MAKLIKREKIWYSDLRMDGKRIRRALSRDKRIAEVKLAELIRMREASKHGHVIQDLSWALFKSKYMVYSRSKKPQSHYRDTLAFKKLENKFHLAKLSDLTVERLEQFKSHLRESDNAPGTINRDLKAIRAALNKAVEWGLIKPFNYRAVKFFKEPKGKLHFYTDKEIDRLIAYCEGMWKTIVMLGYYAGLRRGEIHSLKMSAIDYPHNRIHIAPTEEFTPKDHERRFVPIAPVLKAHLQSLPKGHTYVLGDDRPTLDVMTTYARKLIQSAGLTGSLHKLRHTFGSHLAQRGVHPLKIKEWMGHSSLKVTQIYMHLAPPDETEKDINRLGSGLVPQVAE